MEAKVIKVEVCLGAKFIKDINMFRPTFIKGTDYVRQSSMYWWWFGGLVAAGKLRALEGRDVQWGGIKFWATTTGN